MKRILLTLLALSSALQSWGQEVSVFNVLNTEIDTLGIVGLISRVESIERKLNINDFHGLEGRLEEFERFKQTTESVLNSSSNTDAYYASLIRQRKRYLSETPEFLFRLSSINSDLQRSISGQIKSSKRNNLRSLTNNGLGFNLEDEIVKIAKESILTRENGFNDKDRQKMGDIIISLVSSDNSPTKIFTDNIPVVNSVVSFLAAVVANNKKSKKENFDKFRVGIQSYFDFYAQMDKEFARHDNELSVLITKSENLRLFILSYGKELSSNIYRGSPEVLRYIDTVSTFFSLYTGKYHKSKIDTMILECNCDNDLLTNQRFVLNEAILMQNVAYIKGEIKAILSQEKLSEIRLDKAIVKILEDMLLKNSKLDHKAMDIVQRQIQTINKDIETAERMNIVGGSEADKIKSFEIDKLYRGLVIGL